MSGANVDLGNGLVARIDADPPLSEKYFDIVDKVFCEINGWRIGPVDRARLYRSSRIVVLTRGKKVLGGFTCDRTPQPEIRIHARFQGQSGLPPLDLISRHKNISYTANLVLIDEARQSCYRGPIKDLTIAVSRLQAKAFVIVTPALAPHRLDIFYEMHGFSRISQPLFNSMYSLSAGDREPNCVMMMRSISPDCSLDSALLKYGVARA